MRFVVVLVLVVYALMAFNAILVQAESYRVQGTALLNAAGK